MSWLRGIGKPARFLRSIAFLLNLHSLCLCVVGCTAVYLCEVLQLKFSLDISVVVFGVTFSVTFAITQAYQRRERALMTIAELKASIVALYWQHRDWCQGPGYPGSLGDDSGDWAKEFASVAMDYLENLQKYIGTSEGYESVAEAKWAAKRNAMGHLLLGNTNLQQDVLGETFVARFQTISAGLPGQVYLMRAYSALSKISVMNEYLTHKAHYLRGGEGGMSRTAQYLRYLVAQMEQLRMIKIYRTPVMLRHACVVLVNALTILLAPYFCHVGVCDDGGFAGGDDGTSWCPAPYTMACLWVLITTLLLHVQASNEQPLDMTGVDDVFLELTDEFNDIIANTATPSVDDDGRCFAEWRRQFDSRWRQQAQQQQEAS